MIRCSVLRYVMMTMIPLLISLSSHASGRLWDLIEYNGPSTIVIPEGGLRLDLPVSEKLKEIHRENRCTAGGPTGKWRIEDNRLWLIGLRSCDGDIPLQNIYGGNGKPILATWVTRKLFIAKGRLLCFDRGFGEGISETTVMLRVKEGLLIEVSETSNKSNPAIATITDLRKILEPGDGREKRAQEIVADSGWECLSPETQAKLRGNQIPEPAVR
jgi:hypothetical protein